MKIGCKVSVSDNFYDGYYYVLILLIVIVDENQSVGRTGLYELLIGSVTGHNGKEKKKKNSPGPLK